VRDIQVALGIGVFVCACWYWFMKGCIGSMLDYWIYAIAGLCMILVPFVIVFIKDYRSVNC